MQDQSYDAIDTDRILAPVERLEVAVERLAYALDAPPAPKPPRHLRVVSDEQEANAR